MLKISAIAGMAIVGAFAATGASAHGSQYSSTYKPAYTTTYAAPTIDLGPIEYVQPQSTVQYNPYVTTTVVPATTTTYTAPVYSAPTYSQPIYTTPTYTNPAYTAPSYIAPRYDGTDQVRSRLRNQRQRIQAAEARGDLRGGELARLRSGMQQIRSAFRGYRDNDGVIGQWEQQDLNRMLDDQSRRIARLANNRRTVHGPYRHRAY